MCNTLKSKFHTYLNLMLEYNEKELESIFILKRITECFHLRVLFSNSVLKHTFIASSFFMFYFLTWMSWECSRKYAFLSLYVTFGRGDVRGDVLTTSHLSTETLSWYHSVMIKHFKPPLYHVRERWWRCPLHSRSLRFLRFQEVKYLAL